MATSNASKTVMKTPKNAPAKSLKSRAVKSAPRKTNKPNPPLHSAVHQKASNVEMSQKKSGMGPVKTKKPKLVRDSFTMPKKEHAVLSELKARAEKLSKPAKKGELIRAGINALAFMSDAAFISALAQVPTLKTGRPKRPI